MSAKSMLRRAIALTGLVLLTAGTTAVAAAPAQAVAPDVVTNVSPSTAQPGDTVTVTQTVTNNLVTALLQPAARLVSAPNALAAYTELMGCTGATCSVLNDASGQPIGYQALLPSSLGALGGSSVVTYTLRILPGAPVAAETLRGQLAGLGFLSNLIDGATLILNPPLVPPLGPISQLNVSPSSAQPGDIVTVTQTVANNLAVPLALPVARLTSGPDPLTAYTELVSCAGAACSVLNNASGQPIGYQAVLPSSLGALGGSSVVTYTLRILPGVPDLDETLQGQLTGLSFVSALIDGLVHLIVDAPPPPPASQLTVTPSTAHPNDTVTVTQTLTNTSLYPLLQPAGRLLSSPDGLTSYTSLAGCTGAGCSVLTNGVGQSIGYQAMLPSSINPRLGTSVVTYTLKVRPEAPDLHETLQGQLAGQLLGSSFLSSLLDGAFFTVDANADAAVAISATPRLGLLARTLDFAVTVTNNGPGYVRLATITTSLPGGLSAASSGPCVPVTGAVTCPVVALAQGASTTLRFSVPLNLLDIGLPYTFTSARTASVSRDLNPANDSASARCTVLTPLLVTCSPA